MSGGTPGNAPLAYSSALAIDTATMRRVPEAVTIADETRIVLERLDRRLKDAGLGLRDIMKTTCYISDESYRGEFIRAYTEVMSPGPYPARCTIVLGLAGDCRVQVEAVAASGN